MGNYQLQEIKITYGMKQAKAKVKRMQTTNPEDVFAKLTSEAASAYMSTQAAVHIETESLKLSGKFTTKTYINAWRAKITYGGPSLGIKNPVKYAVYEMARGGAHDWMKPARNSYFSMEDTIKRGLPK